MASIISYGDGLKRIDFVPTPNGQRKTLRLGKVNVKVAEVWKAKVEAIIADRNASRPHDAEVSKWLGGLDEAMLSRMRAAGLAEGVGLATVTLKAFIDRFMAALPSTKPNTVKNYRQTANRLLEHFGEGRAIQSLTAADADAWRAWMLKENGLATATVSRAVKHCRTMWKQAARWRMASDNVFAGVKSGKQSNDARQHFIARDVAEVVMKACPNAQWRLIFALSRYGGLRCPSEHLALQWQDIDFDRRRIVVHSPKTEHHEGGESRTIPLFPELEKSLLDAFAAAEEGSEYVIADRDPGVNWRTGLQRIIRNAKVEPWPKLFHNLRASRETELMARYPLKTVCKWMGNSPTIAAQHYAVNVDLDGDFRRAAGIPETGAAEAQRNAQQSAVNSKCQQMPAEMDEGGETLDLLGNCIGRQKKALAGISQTSALLPPRGVEPLSSG